MYLLFVQLLSIYIINAAFLNSITETPAVIETPGIGGKRVRSDNSDVNVNSNRKKNSTYKILEFASPTVRELFCNMHTTAVTPQTSLPSDQLEIINLNNEIARLKESLEKAENQKEVAENARLKESQKVQKLETQRSSTISKMEKQISTAIAKALKEKSKELTSLDNELVSAMYLV